MLYEIQFWKYLQITKHSAVSMRVWLDPFPEHSIQDSQIRYPSFQLQAIQSPFNFHPFPNKLLNNLWVQILSFNCNTGNLRTNPCRNLVPRLLDQSYLQLNFIPNFIIPYNGCKMYSGQSLLINKSKANVYCNVWPNFSARNLI